MKTWEKNGCTLMIDFEDVAAVERYENAFMQYDAQAEELQVLTEKVRDGAVRLSALVRAQCERYRALFDGIFGEGTADAVFADAPLNLAVYDTAFAELLSYCQEAAAAAAQARSERLMALQKYLPDKDD